MGNRRTPSGRGALFCEVAGSGVPVVFVHAFPLNHRMWGPQLLGLRDRAMVIAVDLPGFGQSPPAEAPSIPGFAEAVLGVLDHHGIDRAVVVGCSMGGYVAQALALAHPDRVAAIGLAGTRSRADTPEVKARRDELVAIVRERGMAPVPERQLPKLLGPDAQRDPGLVRLVREIVLEATPAGLMGAAVAMASRADVTPRLAAITCPAVVIIGTEDAIIPLAEANAMAAALPRGRSVPIAGAGHLANLEASNVFNHAILDLVAAVPA